MPRSARKGSVYGIYHVMMRGINRQAIFDDDEDCRRFMDILADLPFQHDDDGMLLPIRTCVVYAWCLMTNHFHLLVMEKDWKIADVIKSLASSYVFYYNKKNERIGHLFQERFKSEPCNDMEYFTTLLRYIHQNPVKAGIVENAADYEWSSWSQDYLRDVDEGWPISHVRAVLKRIPLEDLTALVNELCDANCVDVDNSRRLQDIIVYLEREGKKIPLYYIEVKSRWSTKESVEMSKLQMETSSREKERYALCVVDMHDYDKEKVFRKEYPKTFEEIKEQISVVTEIGCKNADLVPYTCDSKTVVHIGGEVKSVVPQDYVKAVKKDFDSLMETIAKKVREEYSEGKE